MILIIQYFLWLVGLPTEVDDEPEHGIADRHEAGPVVKLVQLAGGLPMFPS